MLLYSLLRIGVFAAILTALLMLQIEPWIAAIVAAIVGLCVTYIFFRGARDEVARSFYEFRTAEPRDADGDHENAALDSEEPRG
ncbi:MAG: hypothetical protein JWL94_2155 [Microbacteriaceae bacterium]|nr:hypothetical protein [Microbacteriaceae bacterium]